MARLIVLNGPPGCGKSTLARRYVQDHPLALNLDVDRIRDLLGGWRDSKPNALRRFAARADTTGDPAHRAAAELLNHLGGAAELAAMYDRLQDIIATRHHAVVIHNPEGQAGTAYAAITRVVT